LGSYFYWEGSKNGRKGAMVGEVKRREGRKGRGKEEADLSRLPVHT